MSLRVEDYMDDIEADAQPGGISSVVEGKRAIDIAKLNRHRADSETIPSPRAQSVPLGEDDENFIEAELKEELKVDLIDDKPGADKIKRKYWFGTWKQQDGKPDPSRLIQMRAELKGLCLLVFQTEEGRTTKYPHYQFVVGFNTPVDFAWWRNNVINGLDVRVWLRGIPTKDLVKVVRYCSKEDTRIPGPTCDLGKDEILKPKRGNQQGKRTDIADCVRYFKEEFKGNMDDVPLEHIETYIKFPKYFDKICVKKQLQEEVPFKHAVCLYGKTGHGKTYRARKMAKQLVIEGKANAVYEKDGQTKWWDGYDGQEVVIVNDFRPNNKDPEILAMWLNILDPKIAWQVQVKGSMTVVRARYFIFTSPSDPSGWFAHTCEVDDPAQQLLRRMNTIMHCDKPFISPEPLPTAPKDALDIIARFCEDEGLVEVVPPTQLCAGCHLDKAMCECVH